MKRGQPCGSDGLGRPFPSHYLRLSCFPISRLKGELGEGTFISPGTGTSSIICHSLLQAVSEQDRERVVAGFHLVPPLC